MVRPHRTSLWPRLRGLAATHRLALILALLFAGTGLAGTGLAGGAAAGAEAVPQPSATPQYPIEDFLTVTSLRGLSFSPDAKKVLVATDQSGVFNVYAFPTDGGQPVQLTHSTTDSIYAEAYFPADERLLYSMDQGGNELDHLFVRELDGTVKDLTPGDKLKATFLDFSPDGSSFYVATNERDKRFFDLYRYATKDYARSLFFQNDQGLQPGAISRDERYLALAKPNTTDDVDVVLVDRQSGESKLVTAHEGTAANRPADFTPDGKALLLTSNQGSEFTQLVRYDLASGARTTLVTSEWDVQGAGFSRDGRFLGLTINRDARNEVRLYRWPELTLVPLPDLPGLDLTSMHLSADGKELAFYASSSRWPANLFVYDFQGAPRRLTQTQNPKIDPEDLVDGDVVRFKSFDGVEVPGILYKPHQASASHKVPALVLVHGGPGGQSRLGYSGLTQYLVNHGYAIFAINNRGSSGYGKTFHSLDDRDHSGGDLGDCVASKGMLTATGWVDPERIGIIGGSYGGYMVLAALTFKPREFALGVNLFGVSNWVRTLKSIPPWWEAQRKALYEELGNPETDEEYLRSISPLFHAKNIVRPLFVLQGANDPRVLKVESDEIVAAARANGSPVEYLVFDDEGHGIAKKENQYKAYTAVLAFLDRNLKELAAAPAAAAPAAGSPHGGD